MQPRMLFQGILFLVSCSVCAQPPGHPVRLLITDSIQLPGMKSFPGFVRDSSELYRTLRTLQSGLWESGYLEASADSVVFGDQLARVYFHGGKRYRWADVRLNNTDEEFLGELSFRGRHLPKGPVSVGELALFRERIIQLCENNGYPFAGVSLQDLEFEGGAVSCRVDVEPGQLCTIDSVIIKGSARVSSKYFRKLSGIGPGMIYREERLSMLGRRIEETGFLSEIKPCELEFHGDKADLYAYVDRRAGNQFNGVIGFLPDHGKSGRLLLTGDLNLLLINSFGRGETMALSWLKPEPLTQELHIRTAYPFLFNSDMGAGVDFDLYKQDTTYLTVNPVVNVHYYIDGMNYIRLFCDHSRSVLLGSAGAEPLPAHADMTASVYGLGVLYRKLDYRYNPRRGIRAEGNAGIGRRKVRELPSGGDAAERRDEVTDTRYSGTGFLAAYLPAGRAFTLLLQNRSGWMRADRLYENELFRLGGINSIRGVEENSVLASAYSFFTAEIRYLLEKNSYAFLFLHGGCYMKEAVNERVRDTPLGFGAGISLETRPGIFSITYALGREFGNPVNISRAKIHLGYVSRF